MAYPKIGILFPVAFLACLVLSARADVDPSSFNQQQKELEQLCGDSEKKHANLEAHSNGCEKLNPTVYYTPILKPPESSCGRTATYSMMNERGVFKCVTSAVNTVTKSEGAAVIVDKDGMPEKILKHASKGMASENIPPGNAKACPLGFGGTSRGETVCLNPFKMLATGSSHHKGEVVFVPKTFCMRYPLFPGQAEKDWAFHDGYWIVGDSFGNKQRRSRADFFSGPFSPMAKDNPLNRLGLTDQHQSQQFCHVNADKTASVLKENGFPKELPEHVQAAYRDGSLTAGANASFSLGLVHSASLDPGTSK